LESTVNSPNGEGREENDIWSHQTRSLGCKYTKNISAAGAGSGVFRAREPVCNCNCNWGTCIAPPTRRLREHHSLVAANVILLPLNERQILKQMWLFLNVLYVTVYV